MKLRSELYEIRRSRILTMQRLAEMPFTEVEPAASSGGAIVILPVGVVEEHGPHLPLGLDSFAAEVYAESAGAHLEQNGFEVILAPTISYGGARAAGDFPGTLSLEPQTLTALVTDVGRSLAKHGFNRQVILNGHRDLSHMKALDDACGNLAAGGIQILCLGFVIDPEVTAACYRTGVRELSQSPRGDREGHGCEWESSLALHRFPELLKQNILRTLEPNFDY